MGKNGRWDEEAVARAIQALADGTRLRLLLLLREGKANVSDICGRLGLPQPTVSHHLGILRRYGVVVARRSGKQVFYRLAAAPSGPRTVCVDAGGASVTVQLR